MLPEARASSGRLRLPGSMWRSRKSASRARSGLPARQPGAHRRHARVARLGGPAGGEVDLARPLVGVRRLRVDGQHLAQVIERLVVQAVLHVDVGLGEELLDGVRAGGRAHGAARSAGRRRRPRRAGGRTGRGRRGRAGRGGRGRAGRRGRWRCGRVRQPQRRGGVRVVRRQLLHLAPGGARVGVASLLLVDVRQLLVDRERLAGLPQVAERLRQQVERVHVLGVGLEAELQLGQGPLGVALGQVDVGELLGEAQVVGLQGCDALRHLQVLVGAAVLLEVVGGAPQALQRGPRPAGAGVQLAQLDRGGDVLRVQLHHPLQDVGELAGVAGLLVGGGHVLQLAHGVAHEPELLVQARQPLVDPDVVRGELHDLLVDGDRLEEEPLLGVGLRHAGEGVGRQPLVALLLVELADLEEDADVLGVLGQDLLVGGDRLVERTLLNELGRLRDDLVLVDSHRVAGSREVVFRDLDRARKGTRPGAGADQGRRRAYRMGTRTVKRRPAEALQNFAGLGAVRRRAAPAGNHEPRVGDSSSAGGFRIWSTIRVS